LDAYGVEADFIQPTLSAEIGENDPYRRLLRSFYAGQQHTKKQTPWLETPACRD
jgi:hypothetical protein